MAAAVQGNGSRLTLHEQGFSLMSLDQRRRLFFKYEKRIRELSPPEKAGAAAVLPIGCLAGCD